MKKVIKQILVVVCCVAMMASLVACGSDTAEYGPGEYSFTESAAGGALQVPWTITLNEDGTYELVESSPIMGDIVYAGDTYTIDGDQLTTGPITNGNTPIATFFNEDLSCDWTFGENNTVTPVNFDPDAPIDTSAFMKPEESEGTETVGTVEVEGYDGLWLTSDIVYASNSDAQKLDLYLPESEEPVPVIVMIHGGAFQFGSKTMDSITDCLSITEAGYAIASLDYRMAGEATFPGAVADAKAAVRYLKANAEALGIDGDKIAIWGMSAGAYIANMTALTPEVAELDGDVVDNAEYSSGVNALISWFAPLDFYNTDAEFESLGVTADQRGMGLTSTDTSAESKFIGQNVGLDEAYTQTTNPENYVDQIPADYGLHALYQHGDADDQVPYTQSENMAKALEGAPGIASVTFEKMSGLDHEDAGFYTQENLDRIVAFLDSVFK